MPDISMCTNKSCENNEKCYRYRAVPNEWRQSFFLGSPQKEDGSCDHYWPVEAGDRIVSMEVINARSWT